MKKILHSTRVAFILCLFVCVLPFGALAQTAQISNALFRELGVELEGSMANTYYAGDSILIRGRVTDSRDSVLFFLKNITTGERVSDLYRTGTGGSFELPITFPTTVGKYYFVLASGTSFKTMSPETITLVANTTTVSSGLPFSLSARPTLMSGFFEYLSFGPDIWARMTVRQGTRAYTSAGKIIPIKDIPLRLGIAKVSIQAFPLVGPSSLDQDILRGMTWSGSVYIDRVRNLVGKSRVILRTIRNVGIIQFRIPKGTLLRSEYYLTQPNGKVIEKTFAKEYIAPDGYLLPDIQIRESFMLSEGGIYKVEAVLDNGNAYFNLPISKSTFWGIYRPHTSEDLTTLSTNTEGVRNYSLQAINTIRAGLGQKSLILDPILTDLAQKKAMDMAKYDYVGHRSHDGNYIKDFGKSLGINISGTYGENVAGCTRTSGCNSASHIALQDGLEESGSHRSTMTGDQYTKIGIGYMVNGKNTYLVQVFTD